MTLVIPSKNGVSTVYCGQHSVLLRNHPYLFINIDIPEDYSYSNFIRTAAPKATQTQEIIFRGANRQV